MRNLYSFLSCSLWGKKKNERKSDRDKKKIFFHSKLNKGQSNQFIAKLITRKKKRREEAKKKKIFSYIEKLLRTRPGFVYFIIL